MKKRILALLLCLLMVLPMLLTSCGGGDNPEDTTNNEDDIYVKPATLNFYIIGDNFTTAAVSEMQKEFNKLSRSLYKNQVEFIFCTEEEYEKKLLGYELEDGTHIMGDIEEAAAITGNSAAEKFEASVPETSLNMLKVPIEKYPDLYDNQIDIVLINSKDLYTRLQRAGHLADLTTLLNTSFSDIPQRVNSNLVAGATDKGHLYGVPNNVLIGHYEYLLVHKDMAYLAGYYQEKDFLTFNSDTKKNVVDYDMLLSFAETIQSGKTLNSSLYQQMKSKYQASEIYALDTTFAYPTVTYFNTQVKLPEKDENGKDVFRMVENTIFGSVYEYNSTLGSEVSLINVFADEYYRSHYALMLEASAQNFCPAADAVTDGNEVYAIKYVTGSYTDRNLYSDDYFVYELDQPRLDDDAAFEAMFAVTSYSASTERSLEIIGALVAGTTDEEIKLRNILQYGLLNTHYKMEKVSTGGAREREIVKRTSNDYVMNANYTGNLVTAYPCPEDGRGLDFNDHFTSQNKASTQNPLYGMTAADLWADTLDGMTKRLRAEMAVAALTAEINALPDNDLLFNSISDKSAFRKELIAGIPTFVYYPDTSKSGTSYSASWSALRDYWYAIEADVNPLIEYEDGAAPEIPYAATSAVNKKLNTFRDEAEAAATEFIEKAVLQSEAFMLEALNCKTKADLDALCDRMLVDLKDDKVNGVYFYNDRVSYPQYTTSFFGLLSAVDKDVPNVSTLTGALYAWYKTVNGTAPQ